jgi:hypothetical protein
MENAQKDRLLPLCFLGYLLFHFHPKPPRFGQQTPPFPRRGPLRGLRRAVLPSRGFLVNRFPVFRVGGPARPLPSPASEPRPFGQQIRLFPCWGLGHADPLSIAPRIPPAYRHLSLARRPPGLPYRELATCGAGRSLGVSGGWVKAERGVDAGLVPKGRAAEMDVPTQRRAIHVVRGSPDPARHGDPSGFSPEGASYDSPGQRPGEPSRNERRSPERAKSRLRRVSISPFPGYGYPDRPSPSPGRCPGLPYFTPMGLRGSYSASSSANSASIWSRLG